MSSQTQILPFKLLFCVSDTIYPEVSAAEGMGKPVRHIPIQHWSQFSWNERLVYEGSWAYKQITANVGYFHDLQLSAFFDQQPLEVWSELVYLY